MNIYIAMIPARGGSKRLPGKNLRSLAGNPMIVYTIKAAKQCDELIEVFVSTDSPEIQRIAGTHGACAHALRDPKFAADQTSSLDTICYEIDRLENLGKSFTHLVLLQPTSPLRTTNDIKGAIELFEASAADTLTSVNEETGVENGAIFILDRHILKGRRFYGDRVVQYKMPASRSIDVDQLDDFEKAEEMINCDPST